MGVVVDPKAPFCNTSDWRFSTSKILAVLGNEEIWAVKKIVVNMVDNPLGTIVGVRTLSPGANDFAQRNAMSIVKVD